MQITQDSIEAFLNAQKESGVSEAVFRQRRGFVRSL